MSKTMELRKQLLTKKAELLGSDKPEYKTSGMFRPQTFSSRFTIDIKIASQQEVLESYKAMLNHKQACTDLGIDTKHLGFTTEEWTEDFKTRLAVLNRSRTLAEIEAIEKEITPLLTTKEAREIGIDAIAEKIAKV